jgi:hypothetical protein
VKRALLLIAVVACTGPEPGATDVPRMLSLPAYMHDIQPIFEGRCATLDCHGNVQRPLRMFAETGLRASDSLRNVQTPIPITPEELASNVAAANAVDGAAVDPDDSVILQKPLGQMKHTGGTLWLTPDDPQAVCVRGWLAGTSGDPDIQAACATAATQVALPPP